jgi:methylmalonic aciduria homocystinuria type C protein
MLEAFRGRCAEGGFDLVAPFDIADYNAMAAGDHQLPDHGRRHALAVVVGNTRRLWPVFLAACRVARPLPPDPLDAYTVRVLSAAAEAEGCPFAVRWAHSTQPRPIPIQRVAAAAGLAQLAPCHLSIHPEHGPWIALRALLVFDAEPPPPAPPPPHPCQGCPQPCMPALGQALTTTDWRAWLAVRDACPVGRGDRYSDSQIAYHYSKRGLEEALE